MCMKRVNLIWCQSETITIRIDLQCLHRLKRKQWKTIGNSQVGILSPVSHPFLRYLHPKIYFILFFASIFFLSFLFTFVTTSASFICTSPFCSPHRLYIWFAIYEIWYRLCSLLLLASVIVYLYTILVNAALVFMSIICVLSFASYFVLVAHLFCL